MLSFRVQIRPGASLFEQVVYAAKKSIVSGQLRPGDAFPSVRVLSKELRINPNTAAKIVSHLVGEGLIETLPGIGTVVATLPESTHRQRARLVERELEQLVVEARRLGLTLDEVVAAIGAHWQSLNPQDHVPGDRPKP